MSHLLVWRMDRATFELRLRAAAEQACQLAGASRIGNITADDLVFLLYPNMSYDGDVDPRVEVIFPGDSLHGGCHGPWSAEEVVDFLWRDGKVPEWIDVYVQVMVLAGAHIYHIRLNCCGRFTAQEGLLYHQAGGLAPFQPLGPCS